MGQSLSVLHQVKDFSLKAVVVRDDQEADQFFSCSDIVNIARLRIHYKLLCNLAETIPKERIDLVEVLFAI